MGVGVMPESVGTPRSSRSVTAQAAPRAIRRVACERTNKNKRNRKREGASACTPLRQRVECTAALVGHNFPRTVAFFVISGFFNDHPFRSRDRDRSIAREREWKPVTDYRLLNLKLNAKKKQEKAVIVSLCRGGASAGADPAGNAFLWRRSGDSQDPSLPGDVGKSRSVLIPRSRCNTRI